MKITLNNLKPRNPLVASVRFRRAGTHRQDGAALRQQGDRSLRRELDQLTRPKDSP